MERLEAAMVKARAARGQARAALEAADVAAGTPQGSGDWALLPTIEIPPRQARRKRLHALLGQQFATPYDILRSRVVRQMKEAGWTRLAVTSPTTKCGKSTISLNLALSLARYGQFRVILMDFDLRRPALAGLLNVKNGPDISGLLRPGARLTDYAVRFGPNLALCSNRSQVRHSAELLQSAATADALDRIEAEWKPDMILFDTPPMQGNDDNLGFFSKIDCALIVAAAGSSTVAQIDRCEQEVGHLTNILGTVLNKCRYSDDSAGFDQSYY